MNFRKCYGLDFSWTTLPIRMFWKKLFRRQEVSKHDFVLAYETLFSKPIPSVRRIAHLDFIVIDTETTGLNTKTDEILSFGGIKVRSNRIFVSSAIELNLEVSASSANSAHIHQIIVSEKPLSKDLFAKSVLSYLGRDIVVGHHIGFDRAMLENVLKPYGLKYLINPFLDTATLASRLENGPRHESKFDQPGAYSLEALCERYEIPVEDRHTASGDAYLTAQLLIKLLKIAETKGIKEFGDLIK